MARTNIQQFRAALADAADQSPLTRAYRRIANASASVAAHVGVDWAVWPPAVAATGESQAGARLAAWGDWATPPAAAA